ncbi:hypothetical protein OGM63_19605 [Plectonema radiosum NIES-515]|uniref:Uncharacterized protein n=1 Tax=Plectonema radiosum NIES-515 TaxID=2986073 RepID=A0ABT3B2T8_9CYAN|nr:hypothetical protein [Plectonema radiosum]MCV3215691.1 hypothetical protein [Plectonema radiosum NIES-515]
MTQIIDLTWQQLETASGLPLMVFDNNLGILVRVSPLIGNITIPNNYKDAMGVVQALYQLRQAAASAQIAVNTGQSIGERLAAFPPASNGTAVNGFVMSSGQIITRTPLASTGIIGASN